MKAEAEPLVCVCGGGGLMRSPERNAFLRKRWWSRTEPQYLWGWRRKGEEG